MRFRHEIKKNRKSCNLIKNELSRSNVKLSKCTKSVILKLKRKIKKKIKKEIENKNPIGVFVCFFCLVIIF